MPISGTMMVKFFRVAAQKAYFLGGASSGDQSVNTADKLVFATATTSAVASANISTARFLMASVSDKEKGFSCGGYVTGEGTGRNIIDKVTYSTDTTSAMGITINLLKYASAGISAITKGYLSGGCTGIKVSQLNTEVLTYSTETIAATTTANIGQAKWGLASMNAGTTHGYYAGGRTNEVTPGDINTSDKIIFSIDTRSALGGNALLSTARFGVSGLSQGVTHGYYGGGATGTGWTQQRIIDKVVFATDNVSVLAAELYNERVYCAPVSEGLSCGYFSSTDWGNVAQLMNFATDVSSNVASANLSLERYGVSGVSQSAF